MTDPASFGRQLPTLSLVFYPENGSMKLLETSVTIYQTTWRHIPEDNLRGITTAKSVIFLSGYTR
jgi:hypothetical protein